MLAYYDSSSATASQRKYKYLATSDLAMDDSAFRQDKGYWIHTNEAGTLTIPSVGGTTSGETYSYEKLRFMNGTDEKNITQAGSAGWVDLTFIQYHDTNVDDYMYVCSCVAGGRGGCDDFCLADSFNSWQGYFIKSNYDNITLIRQN